MSSKAMCVGDYRGHKLCVPTSGGKAGKRKNLTSSLQVRVGTTIIKQFRFNTAGSWLDVKFKATQFIDERCREIRMMS